MYCSIKYVQSPHQHQSAQISTNQHSRWFSVPASLEQNKTRQSRCSFKYLTITSLLGNFRLENLVLFVLSIQKNPTKKTKNVQMKYPPSFSLIPRAQNVHSNPSICRSTGCSPGYSATYTERDMLPCGTAFQLTCMTWHPLSID